MQRHGGERRGVAAVVIAAVGSGLENFTPESAPTPWGFRLLATSFVLLQCFLNAVASVSPSKGKTQR